ncbi:MAG: hypothetical protein DHS20C02_07480 [Micavibrio sp.]|nr:MAG: hypothetical protein DHS20C02_07480 [Micavibrio sp.]
MSYDFKNVNVLVVESSTAMYQLIKNVLNMLTVPERNIQAAYDIEGAFAKFCQTKHDIVMSDWLENPDHGIQLTRMIRTNKNSPNIYVPIIMTAGSGHYTRVVRARDAGISEYLVKPFAADALAKRIVRVIESPRLFVASDAYTGPDRRTREMEYEGPERRKEPPEVVQA